LNEVAIIVVLGWLALAYLVVKALGKKPPNRPKYGG